MDIHRCRFVPYPPSTINALAFSHSQITGRKSGRDLRTLRLAIGRANGDIEIWNPLNGAWLQETILRGGKDRSVDGLVWIQDPDEDDGTGQVIKGRLRLFSIGYTTTVTEWDLEKGQPLRQASGNHGEIWCLAAQPMYVQSSTSGATEPQWTGQNLVTGCTDGAVVLYSSADSDLQLQKVLVRPSAKKAKIISVVFQDRNIVVAGCTDSTIRIFDIRNGSLLRNMSLGAGPSGGPKEIIVWAVRCLPDGNIVSGDSTGELRIWDGKTYTLVQRIKSHRQDILSLAMSADGGSIFSGGMDRRTTVYKQVGSGKPRWAEVSHRRYHDHDVKTMATFEGKGLSVVVSGGPDASPIVLPLKEFGMENQRALPSLPQDPVVQSASRKRLLMSWWDREVHIWRINKSTKPAPESAESESEAEDRVRTRKLVAKVLIKGEANITSAAISADGCLLAVSTALELKMFKLKARGAEEGETLKVTKIDIPISLSSSGVRLLQFSPDGKWIIIVRTDNRVYAARIAAKNEILSTLTKLERLDRKIEKRVLLGGLGSYERSISRIAFSSESRIVAVGDLAGYIDTWVLHGEEDLDITIEDAHGHEAESEESDSEDDDKTPTVIYGQHWARTSSASQIPKLPSAPLVLSFRPANGNSKPQSNGISPHATRHNPHPVNHQLAISEDRLLVVTAESVGASSKVLEFNVLQGSLTAWSRSNPTSNFPEEYKGLKDQAMGCLWDLSNGKERVWLYGSSWLWMFDLSRDIPVYENDMQLTNDQSNGVSAGTSGPQRKRRRISHGDDGTDLRRGTSGAGGKVPDHELSVGISRKMQRFITGESGEVRNLAKRQISVDIDDEDDENDDNIMIIDSRVENGTEVAAMGAGEADGPPHWWNTYKYRPIMGIVPIEGSPDTGLGAEVVLVERPIWEAELPPRYYGDQEWDTLGM